MKVQIAPISIEPCETELNKIEAYFRVKWNNHQFESLNTLILNSCFVDLKTIEWLLQSLPCLHELHLSSNNYSAITFSENFTKKSLRTLYFCSNGLSDWNELFKLGKNFPELQSLVISQNNLGNLNPTLSKSEITSVFPHLTCLNLNGLLISGWDTIYRLGSLPVLKSLRIKGNLSSFIKNLL